MSSKRASVFQPSAGPASNSFENPRRTGFMTKHGGQGFKANWKRRYFVLDSGYLFYYASENEKKPLGIVCLADYCACRRVSSDDPKSITKKSPNMIMLKAVATSDPTAVTRDYFMFADTEEEVSLWVSAVSEEISTAQHDDSLFTKSVLHRKDTPDVTVVSKGRKMTKDDQKSFDEVTKRAGESSALQHITASRPRPVGRRKPRKYLTYDEDDVASFTTSSAPHINQSEVENHTSVAEKRTHSSPGRHRALLPRKTTPLVPPGGGTKAQRPVETGSAAAQSNGPPPLPSGKKPFAEDSVEAPLSNGPPPLPSSKKPSAEGSVEAPQSNGPPPLPSSKKPSAEGSVEAPQSNGPPPLPSSKKPTAEGSVEVPLSNGPPPLPSSKKPSAEGSSDAPKSSGPPPLPSGKPKLTTEPTEDLNVKATDDVPAAEKGPSADESPPVPPKKLKQMADHVAMEPENADAVARPRKGPPPPLPAKEKPSMPQPTTPPETQVKKTANGSEQSPSTPTKEQPVALSPISEPVGGSSPKLAPKPATSAYKPRLSPSIVSKRQSDEQMSSAPLTSKPKGELPLPKPRHRASMAEDSGSTPQPQQATLPKPVPKPRARSSSGTRSEDASPSPTLPVGKPEEGTAKATSAETMEEDKPATPTLATTPQPAAEAEKDKPPTPQSAAMAEKSTPSTPMSAATPQPVSPAAEVIETNPSSVQTAVRGPVTDMPEPTLQAGAAKEAEGYGVQEDKKAESPQKQLPGDVVVAEAPPTVTTIAPPTSQEAALPEELGVQASPPPLEQAAGEKGQDDPDTSSDDGVYELPPDAEKVPCSMVGVDAAGVNAERIPQSPVQQLPSTGVITGSTTAQLNDPKDDDASEQYEPFELPSRVDAASKSPTAQQSASKEDSGGQYEPFELASEQKQDHRTSASVETCESSYQLVDASSGNELKEKVEGEAEEDDTYANEGSDHGNEDSDDLDDVYEAMAVPEDETIEGMGYVKMKPGASINVLTPPPRRARAEQGYDNVRLRSSPYSGHNVKGLMVSLPRDREGSHSHSRHSSTSTEYEVLIGATKDEIEGLGNEFDFYPDTTSLNLEQAREVLRLARIARTEAEEMRRKARQELELAERERKDAELIKRNALEILRMAKEKLEHK